jgi:hypothetical protein
MPHCSLGGVAQEWDEKAVESGMGVLPVLRPKSFQGRRDTYSTRIIPRMCNAHWEIAMNHEP